MLPSQGSGRPYKERPAFDAVIQAMSGMMSLTGEPDRPPSRVGASIGDMTASLFAAVGILPALQERHRTGRGLRRRSDARRAAGLLENAFARYLNTGDVPQRIGSRHPLVTPFQAFATADDALVVCCDTEAQWRSLCKAAQRDDLVHDPRFVVAHRECWLCAGILTRMAFDIWPLGVHAASPPCCRAICRTRTRPNPTPPPLLPGAR
jgi:CoA:oxalate CoA-transferase